MSQLDRSKIKNGFHGDQLKLFRPREGYLIPEFEHELEVYQNIRAKRTKAKLPNPARRVGDSYSLSVDLELSQWMVDNK